MEPECSVLLGGGSSSSSLAAFIDLFYWTETGRFYTAALLRLKTLQTFTLFLTELRTRVKERVRWRGVRYTLPLRLSHAPLFITSPFST